MAKRNINKRAKFYPAPFRIPRNSAAGMNGLKESSCGVECSVGRCWIYWKIIVLMLTATTNLLFAHKVLADSTCDSFYKQFNFVIGGQPDNTVQGLPQYCTASSVLTFAINGTLIFAGSIAVLFLMTGGFWYLTSGGNEEQAEKGKKTVVNSILGLVIIIMSFAIVRVVTSLLTSQ
jgi:hypothetical protein